MESRRRELENAAKLSNTAGGWTGIECTRHTAECSVWGNLQPDLCHLVNLPVVGGRPTVHHHRVDRRIKNEASRALASYCSDSGSFRPIFVYSCRVIFLYWPVIVLLLNNDRHDKKSRKDFLGVRFARDSGTRGTRREQESNEKRFFFYLADRADCRARLEFAAARGFP